MDEAEFALELNQVNSDQNAENIDISKPMESPAIVESKIF